MKVLIVTGQKNLDVPFIEFRAMLQCSIQNSFIERERGRDREIHQLYIDTNHTYYYNTGFVIREHILINY